MHQIYQSIPVVWRSDRCIQFGVDEPVLIDGLSAQDTELISLLRLGVAAEDYAGRAALLGVSASRAASLLSLLDEAGVLLPPGPPPAADRPTTCADPLSTVLGSAPQTTAAALAGTTVLISGPLRRRLPDELTAAGLLPQIIDRAEEALAHHSPLVILTGIWVEDAVSASLLLEHGIAHLQLVVGLTSARISHVIVPGITPCTRCAFNHRTDEDADWMLAWQSLWRQNPPQTRVDSALTALASTHAVMTVRNHLLGVDPQHSSTSISLPHGVVSTVPAEFHDACDCVVPLIGELRASA